MDWPPWINDIHLLLKIFLFHSIVHFPNPFQLPVINCHCLIWSLFLVGHNGEEAIPMLMLNHSDGKGENPVRSRAPSNADKTSILIGVDHSVSSSSLRIADIRPAGTVTFNIIISLCHITLYSTSSFICALILYFALWMYALTGIQSNCETRFS